MYLKIICEDKKPEKVMRYLSVSQGARLRIERRNYQNRRTVHEQFIPCRANTTTMQQWFQHAISVFCLQLKTSEDKKNKIFSTNDVEDI